MHPGIPDPEIFMTLPDPDSFKGFSRNRVLKRSGLKRTMTNVRGRNV
jgi:hypothetical protein